MSASQLGETGAPLFPLAGEIKIGGPPLSLGGEGWGEGASSFLLLAAADPAEPAGPPWSLLKEKHFLIHYLGGDTFAREVGRRAEAYYRTITQDLGMPRRDSFWLWDDRVSIYLYTSHADFVAGSGAPSWAGARADYKERRIASFEGSPRFLDTLLPHELTHLVFRDYVGEGEQIPLWLDEGVAQWEEQAGREEAERDVKTLLKAGRLLPLATLMTADIRKGGPVNAAVFYAQARSLVKFLMDVHGPERFRKLCAQLRDAKTFEDALRFTYGDRMASIADMETQWRRHIGQEESKQ